MRVYHEDSGKIRFVTQTDAEQDTGTELTSFVHPGPVDPSTDWVPEPGVVEPIPAGGIPTDLATAKANANQVLRAIAQQHKMGGIDVVITYAQATVPADTYWCQTTDTAFAQLSTLHQRLMEIPDGDTVIFETMNEQILDLDLDTFGFFSQRIFGHYQSWSIIARRAVMAQIDASSDPGAMDIQALYDTAYGDAKTAAGQY